MILTVLEFNSLRRLFAQVERKIATENKIDANFVVVRIAFWHSDIKSIREGMAMAIPLMYSSP